MGLFDGRREPTLSRHAIPTSISGPIRYAAIFEGRQHALVIAISLHQGASSCEIKLNLLAYLPTGHKLYSLAFYKTL